jgi:hypothetical protein
MRLGLNGRIPPLCHTFDAREVAMRWILALVAAVCTLAQMPASPQTYSSSSKRVSLTKGARLPQSLQRLNEASGGVLLAEIPAVDRQLLRDQSSLTVSQSAEEISKTYLVYCISRGSDYSFLKRYVDPRESTEFEPQELAEYAGTLARLIGPFAPPAEDFFGQTAVTDKIDFVKSLSGDQAAAMQRVGLPFNRLRTDQQKVWLKITAVSGYGGAYYDLQSVANGLRSWKQASLSWQETQDLRYLALRYPDPQRGDRIGLHVAAYGGNPPPAEAPSELSTVFGPVGPRGETIPKRRVRLDGVESRSVTLVGGESTVGDIIRNIETAVGCDIRVTAPRAKRRLLAYGRGVPAGNVLATLEDLYGWKLLKVRDSLYNLAPANPAPARDRLELSAALKRATPPQIDLLLDLEGQSGQGGRIGDQWARALRLIDKQKKGWSKVQMSEVDGAASSRIANAFFEKQLDTDLGPLLISPPLRCLATPEAGFFTLSGPLGRGNHPFLTFKVPRDGPREDCWGWGVGTSSLDEQ